MYRQYRNIEAGEHFVIGADTSQGGNDENFAQFLSKTRLDIPLVYQRRGVATQMTSDLLPVLERIHDLTGLPPTIAIERQNGGASEMVRLEGLNRQNKYRLFTMPKVGQTVEPGDDGQTTRLGWDTNVVTRPTMLGDLKYAISTHALGIYDDPTLQQLFAFIISTTGKPEASTGQRDDAVMALVVAWQLYQLVDTPVVTPVDANPSRESFDKYGLLAGVT